VAQIGGWGEFDGKGIVGPMITYLLPILIGYTGGKMVYETRGGVVGAIATMGVISGTRASRCSWAPWSWARSVAGR
jgi:PTS system mannitol-specific IIC component